MSSSNSLTSTDFAELLGELNAGVFEEQINRAMSDVAANVCTCGKTGKVTLEFTIKQIDDSNQVSMTHKIKSVVPKQRGKVTEEHETATPLHVGRGGRMTIYPNNQTGMDLGAGTANGRTDGVR
jgi:hypothetical protein